MEKLSVSMIGVSLDLGQSRRGVDMGPSAIRYAGVVERLEALGHQITDEGDIHINAGLKAEKSNAKLKNLKEVLETNQKLAEKVESVLKDDRFPLVLGGDHSIAIGTLAGLSTKYKNMGVIWYDAHADMNTDETSPSGNIHGMPLAVSIGRGDERLVNLHHDGQKIKPQNIVIIGARSIDPGERLLIKELGIQVYTMHEIDKYGMTTVMQKAIQHFEDNQVDGVHLSLDLDALDPLYTPGVGTPVPGGVSYRESHLAMEILEESGLITSAELVEVNPILDERNKTADVAVALMGSLFGEKLL
ncbi:arginase [Sporosarcina pasteurii]|uniref:Arginase n=1 Tax=Sporosarcina pasteurii TaxID=1474 RepID=A0A380CJ95_SPOPA|nr:arginase [Sporosarcina pasteurii]MDS9472046.1 arginase [Sporosarcina pasteurii]QBQ06774.1 arginase [Sporosarcina pasteurii]SUJ20934.1 Arginase [Sporosarcina pasteurii]